MVIFPSKPCIKYLHNRQNPFICRYTFKKKTQIRYLTKILWTIKVFDWTWYLLAKKLFSDGRYFIAVINQSFITKISNSSIMHLMLSSHCRAIFCYEHHAWLTNRYWSWDFSIVLGLVTRWWESTRPYAICSTLIWEDRHTLKPFIT